MDLLKDLIIKRIEAPKKPQSPIKVLINKIKLFIRKMFRALKNFFIRGESGVGPLEDRVLTMFSTNAFSDILAEATTPGKIKGALIKTLSTPETRKCSLSIPTTQGDLVQITAELSTEYSLIDQGKGNGPEELSSPVTYNATAVFSLYEDKTELSYRWTLKGDNKARKILLQQ